MAYRCPNCNKFVSVEEAEPEDQGIAISGDNIEGDVRVVIICADCSSELAENTIHVEVELPEAVVAHECEYEPDLDMTLEADDYFDGDEKVAARYRKHFYGFTGTATITCSCGQLEEVSVDITGHEAAGSFDSLI